MGEQAGVELYGTGDDKCGRCGMTDTKTGCCHDEYKLYQVRDSHKSVSERYQHFPPRKRCWPDHHFLYSSGMPVRGRPLHARTSIPPKIPVHPPGIARCFRLWGADSAFFIPCNRQVKGLHA